MKLVFIHGWALSPAIWDGICALLPDIPQMRVDLGFFDKATEISADDDCILVGHSLGFVHGLRHKKNWRGWIAINSFPRFIKNTDLAGCTSEAELRDIALRLKKNPQQCVADFLNFIGAPANNLAPNAETLRAALETLRDADVADIAASLPGLVIASFHDRLVPLATSQALAKGKEFVLRKSDSHILPLTEPTFCAMAMRQFLEQL